MNFVKPFYKEKFIEKKIINWDDFNLLIKNHPKESIEFIEQGKNEKKLLNDYPNADLTNCSLIFLNAKDVKSDFKTLHEIFKLMIPSLTDHWDAHIYTGHTDKPSSFPVHFDYRDNFILQVEGTSRVIVPHYFDKIFSPGDLLWIPRFVTHMVIPLTRRLSISFPHQ
jgi:ribosomal protein L16 Arg81 hydroxylase|tara:strand:+ start:90 stop:590 length:501 start_codon:yes stop_codon:yes gene_type:complete